MVKARIIRDPNGIHRTEAQRDKYKHWFELGNHKQTDNAFEKALSNGEIQWRTDIYYTDNLFNVTK